MKILLAEDDRRLGSMIKDYLMPESELMQVVNTGSQIKDEIATNDYDILILDVMLPEKNGIDICRELRAENIEIAILFITALNNQNDKIKAFQSGADDYLIKPFDFQELLLRVQALVRRNLPPEIVSLKWGQLVMIPEEKKVYIQDQELNLTPTEFKILQIFLEHPKQVFDTDKIIDKLWDLDKIPTNNTLRSHIKSLRKKLEKIGLHKDFIETVYGMGYKLKDQTSEVCPKNESNQTSKSSSKTEKKKGASAPNTSTEKSFDQQAKLEALIEKMWLDNQLSISQDCDKLKDYIRSTNSNLRTEEAIRIAHNLAGFLGNVGFSNGSKIAKKIENLLKSDEDHLINLALIEQVIDLITQLELVLFPDGKPTTELVIKEDIKLDEKVEILVVDQDQNLANKLILYIEHPQVYFSFAHSVESAINYLEEKEFTLLIVETKWSEKKDSHCQILESIIEQKGDSNIIVYTQDESLENRLYCSEYPICAFLTKNNSIDVLWDNIKVVLSQIKQKSKKKQPYNLVVIDDDEKFIQVLEQKLIIQELPINFHSISNSERFLEFIKKIKPQLVILDLQMPKLNGLDICKILKKDPFLHQIPVIFLTGNLTPEAINQFVQVGADDFISKSKIDIELYPRIMTHLKRFDRISKLN